jgi:hypothetical protein
MNFGLLIDADVFEFLVNLPPSQRRRLMERFREIQRFPGNHSEFSESMDDGRRLDISRFGPLLIYYWSDEADRQVKILKLISSD